MSRRLIVVLVVLAILAIAALTSAGFAVGSSWGGIKTIFTSL